MLQKVLTLFLVAPFALALGGGSLHAQVRIVQQTDCSKLNIQRGPATYGPTGNSAEHLTLGHGWSWAYGGKCFYSGTAQPDDQTPCEVHSQTYSTNSPWENGQLPSKTYHYVTPGNKSADSDCAAGTACTTQAEGAVAVTTCQSQGCGAASIAIGGTAAGGGFNVGYTPANGTRIIWTEAHPYTNTCTGYILSPLPDGTCVSDQIPPVYNGVTYVWSYKTCSWGPPGSSPIAIDIKGNPFDKNQFTDPGKGECVPFDLKGDGIVQCWSFPKPESKEGWLVIDLDGDKRVKNGKWLLGEHSPHSDCGDPTNPDKNGFCALDWYDSPYNGGNGDTLISALDTNIWPKLYLWFPPKHCYTDHTTPCQGSPEEMHPLSEFKITSFGLYNSEQWVDAAGNTHKFQARLNVLEGTKPDHGKNINTPTGDLWAEDIWIIHQ